ncbi:MAG: TatD family hydrolase, partial [Atribacterota bacterium]
MLYGGKKINIQFIETHAHLDMIEREPSEVIDDALRKGVIKIISIGIDLESSRKNSYYASQFKNVYTTMGFHPHESKKMNDEYFVQLEKLLSIPKNIALGEIGLDYHYLHSSKEEQKRAFREQIDLARRYNLPIIVHDRDAHEDTMKILEEKGKNMKMVLHCFSGDKNMAEWCVQRGYY